MNIFYLDQCPVKAAEYAVDKHVVKMVLETAQLLSTAHRVLDGVKRVVTTPGGRKKTVYDLPDPLYDSTLLQAAHVNHPCTVWTRTNTANYDWLYRHWTALLAEYRYRYQKLHRYDMTIITKLLATPPSGILNAAQQTKPAQAMPPDCQRTDPVTAYRVYYVQHKAHINRYKRRERPAFWQQAL